MGYQLRGMAYWLNGDYGRRVDRRALGWSPAISGPSSSAMLEELDDLARATEALRRGLEINDTPTRRH